LIDKSLVLRKIADLEIHLNQIHEFSNITVKKYLEDWKAQRVIERTLQMMIEICIDIASHLISDKGYRTPQTYADTFKVLYENKIINKSLTAKMENMAKFRNVIVHSYDKIDATIVVNILKNNLKDFARFKETIIRFTQTQ